MLQLFADNLLPVFLAAGAGYLLTATTRVDPRPVTHVAFFVLAPCLIFKVLVHGEVGGEALLRMAGFTCAVLFGLAGAAWLLGRVLGWSRSLTAAVVLTTLLPNAGNFGLSANRFAFGETGLAHASVFFVTSAVITFTAGIFVVSLGKEHPLRALIGLTRVPAVWAVPLALLLRGTGWRLPFPVERTVQLLAEATVPVFLIILGMQLRGRGFKAPALPLAVASLWRLAGGVAGGLMLASLFGLEGAAWQAGVLQSSMPSAVICTVLAAEYDTEPSFVTAVVAVTTLISPLTLTPLLAYLGA